MSLHTDLILSISLCEELEEGKPILPIESLNQYLQETHKCVLTRVDGLSQPNVFGGFLFIGVFNYLNIEEFIALLRKQNWYYPESVELFLKTDGEETFTRYLVKRRR